MKRAFLLCALLAFLLSGCSSEPAAVVPETTVPVTTAPVTTAPATETTAPAETEPPHSALYLPGVPVEDVLTWFCEVCLDSEYTDGGDPTRIQKWEAPIAYSLHGSPTPEDEDTLDAFAVWLNTVEGFPGIGPADSPETANLHIHFTDAQGLLDLMGPDYTDTDGAVTFWYDSGDVIYDAVICIRTDLDQQLRSSVILEELYNGLGPAQDTLLRPDSIIYQEFSTPQALTEADELLLRLLYYPDIRCGMDNAQCEAVIRSVYY